jgi:hypothetical protein
VNCPTIAAIVFAGFLATTPSWCQEAPPLSNKELHLLIATARTPADHRRVADYYRGRAHQFAAQQAEEEQIAEHLFRSFATYTKQPNPYQSARNLARYYAWSARKALSQAARQDELAAAAQHSTADAASVPPR